MSRTKKAERRVIYSTKPLFVVACLDYVTPAMSLAQAERRLAETAQFGVCKHEHTIEPFTWSKEA